MIELVDIQKTYYRGEEAVSVLNGISLTINNNTRTALIGASGSGKSTLMNIIGCLDRQTSGKYFFDGKDVSEFDDAQRAALRCRSIGFVFQNFNLLARTTVLDNVLLPSLYLDDQDETTSKERATFLLERVGLSHRLLHTPAELSGGQQQRVAIARSLMNRPKLLLADEPTGNLDSKTSDEILALFDELHKDEGIAIILVTHEPEIAGWCDTVVRLKDGVLVE